MISFQRVIFLFHLNSQDAIERLKETNRELHPIYTTDSSLPEVLISHTVRKSISRQLNWLSEQESDFCISSLRANHLLRWQILALDRAEDTERSKNRCGSLLSPEALAGKAKIEAENLRELATLKMQIESLLNSHLSGDNG